MNRLRTITNIDNARMFRISLNTRSACDIYFDFYEPIDPITCKKRIGCTPQPAVLLLHGWLGSGQDMDGVARYLCARGHCIVVPDLPFHARSYRVHAATPHAAATMITMAVSEILQLNSNRRQPIVVIGYSLGGRIALEIACSRDAHELLDIRRLVLISSAYPPEDAESAQDARRRHAVLAENVRSLTTRDAMKEWLVHKWYGADMWGNLRERPDFVRLIESRLEALNIPREVSEHSDTNCLDRLNAVANAAQILAPSEMTNPMPYDLLQDIGIIYMHGEHDAKYSRVASLFKDQYVHHAHITCIPGAGHNVLVDNLDLSVLILHRFSSPPACGTAMGFAPSTVCILPYSIPLVNAMCVGNQVIKQRTGFLLAIRGKDESIAGVGDVAPLPGLHSESVSDCLHQTEIWAKNVVSTNTTVNIDIYSILKSDLGYNWGRNEARVCSPVKAALGAALCQCLAKANGMELLNFLHATFEQWDSSQEYIDVNGVVPRSQTPMPTLQHSILQARLSDLLQYAKDYSVLKLKVGIENFISSEAKTVSLLASAMREQGKHLRLDANQSWSWKEFESFCHLTQSIQDVIEYIEEPVRANSNSNNFDFFLREYQEKLHEYRHCFPKIALDESMSRFPLKDVLRLISLPGISAVVLKPTVIGSLFNLSTIATVARQNNKKVVLTSAFDSGVGVAWTTVLAAIFGSPPATTHGIGTFSALRHDAVHPGFGQTVGSTTKSQFNIAQVCRYLDIACDSVLDQGSSVSHNT